MSNALTKGRELIGWTTARLAANCALNTEDIERLEASEVTVFANSLAVRVLEQRGVRFEVVAGCITDATGPLDTSRLQEIRISPDDKDCMKLLSRGPLTPRFVEFGAGSWRNLRANGLAEMGTVQEVITFEGEKETRSADCCAVRLSKKGWHYLNMLEAEEKRAREAEEKAREASGDPA
jgi:hypothetical protein